MLIPRLMNGLLKSITRSLSAMIVNGAIARSASYKNQQHCVLIECLLPACVRVFSVVSSNFCCNQVIGAFTFSF